MKRLLTISILFVSISCQQNTKNQQSTANQQEPLNEEKIDPAIVVEDTSEVIQPVTNNNGVEPDKLELTEPTVVIVKLDSLESEELKKADGEDNFYTAADDLMWYNSQLLKKLDSTEVSVKYTKQNLIKVVTSTSEFNISKDSTFSLFTYFFFDGESFKRTELFELLGY